MSQQLRQDVKKYLKINSIYFFLLILVLCSNCALSQKKVIKDTIENKPIMYLYLDKAPSFQGGGDKMKTFIIDHLNYPTEFDGRGIVIVSFVVKSDGSITNPKIEKSLESSCDLEAVKLVNSMPKWKAGELNGKPVDAILYLPINFTIK